MRFSQRKYCRKINNTYVTWLVTWLVTTNYKWVRYIQTERKRRLNTESHHSIGVWTSKIVNINIISSAVLDYIDILSVLFVINLFNILINDVCLPTCCQTLIILCAFFVKLKESCNNSATKLSYRIESNVLSIKTLKIIFNFSVLIFLNFNLIPSINVSGNSDREPESIKDIINTLRLQWNTHVRWIGTRRTPHISVV